MLSGCHENIKNIAEVDESAASIAQRSSQIQISSEDLTKLADRLSWMVGQFKV